MGHSIAHPLFLAALSSPVGSLGADTPVFRAAPIYIIKKRLSEL
ncbi:hypothetical protein AtDm6_2539 [Acetobacter tropicalis]|uniref:Uncharacterized protein n=1 Tax=Acetobacter tropicalis TaxID=104102 RepID=A0A094ZI30_9PROT|nr:hypothetical protein AtDm6_2539 [Acetobacter tropicalis]